MSEVIINPDANMAYLEKHKAIVSFGKGKSPAIEAPTPKILLINSILNVAPWGEWNLFPQEVIEAANFSTIIPAVLEWKAKAMYSSGLVYGTVVNDPTTGEESLKPMFDPYIDAWLKRTNYKRQILQLAMDYYWFYNTFPSLVLSKDRSEIAAVFAYKADMCRLQRQNIDNNNSIDNCYINANWSVGGGLLNSLTVPMFDTTYDPVASLQSRKDSDIYMFPCQYPTPGRIYYSLAPWDSLRSSGWAEVAKGIPEFKKSLLQNQLTIKYHIEVSISWWKWKYPSWDTFSQADRLKKMEEELKKFNDILTGSTNAGRSIMSTFQFDQHSMKEYAGWRITAIDDKLKDGMYVEDSQEASSHHYSALGVDPTLLGNSPGKGMGAGSGSDKRVAFNIYVNNCKADQDIILEPFNFAADYNGWTKKYPNFQFWFRNYYISTLEEGQQMQMAQPIKPEGSL